MHRAHQVEPQIKSTTTIAPKYVKVLKRLCDQLCNSAKTGAATLETLRTGNHNKYNRQYLRNELVNQQIEALNHILNENKNIKR